MKRLYLFLIFGLCVLNMYSGRKEPYRGSRIFWDMRSQQTIFDGGWYARLIQLQDGRLLAVTEVNWDIVISTSEDNGRTWSPQKTVFHHPEGFNYYDADLYQLSDGKIIITYNIGFPSVPGGRFGVRLHISEDNGETWGDEIFVYDGSQHSKTDVGNRQYSSCRRAKYISMCLTKHHTSHQENSAYNLCARSTVARHGVRHRPFRSAPAQETECQHR